MEGKQNTQFLNPSHGGYSANLGIEEIQQCSFIPDLMFVHFGMNDCTNYGVDEYMMYIESIINYVKNINSNIDIVFISTIEPVLSQNVYTGRTAQQIALLVQYENALHNRVQQDSHLHICYMNSYTQALKNAGYTPSLYAPDDGVHPCNRMHHLMAREVLKVVGINYD